MKREQRALVSALTNRCRWGTCTEDFKCLPLAKIRAHIRKHIARYVAGREKMCLWRAAHPKAKPCNQEPEDCFRHFRQIHSLSLRTAEAEDSVFCYPCGEFVASGSEWKHHCAEHLSRLDDVHCDQITFRGLILRQRLCPLCVGDCNLEPDRRWAQLTVRAVDRQNHIERHIAEISHWPQQCTHPRCSAALRTAEDLRKHCYEVHLPDCKPPPGKKGTVQSSEDHDTLFLTPEPEAPQHESPVIEQTTVRSCDMKSDSVSDMELDGELLDPKNLDSPPFTQRKRFNGRDRIATQGQPPKLQQTRRRWRAMVKRGDSHMD